MRYGNRVQQDKAASVNSLFGDCGDIEINKPEIPKCEPWSSLERLGKERELIGIYLSSHPLDRYGVALEFGCTHKMIDVKDLKLNGACNFTIGGLTTNIREGRTKTDRPYAIMTLEDYSGVGEIPFFGKDYIDFGNYLKKEVFVVIRGKIQERGTDWKFRKETPQIEGQKKEWEMKIVKIEMLDEVYQKLVNKLTIDIDLPALDPVLVNDLLSLLESNSGDSELFFTLNDAGLRNPMTLRSRVTHVDVNKHLIDELSIR